MHFYPLVRCWSLFVGYTSRIVEDKDDAPVSCFGINEDGSEKEILRAQVIDEFARRKRLKKKSTKRLRICTNIRD